MKIFRKTVSIITAFLWVFWLQGYLTGWTPLFQRRLEQVFVLGVTYTLKFAPVLLVVSVFGFLFFKAAGIYIGITGGRMEKAQQVMRLLAAGVFGSIAFLISGAAFFLQAQVHTFLALALAAMLFALLCKSQKTRPCIVKGGEKSFLSNALLWSAILFLPAVVCVALTVASWFHEQPNVKKVLTHPDSFWISENSSGEHVYVSGNRNRKLWKLDPATGDVAGAYSLPGSHLQRMEVSVNGRIYVVNFYTGTDQVIVLDGENMTEMGRATHPFCSRCSDLALDEERDLLYVTCENRPLLAAFDIETLELRWLENLPKTHRGAYSAIPSKNGLYVLQSYDGKLLLLDPETLEPLADVFVGLLPAMAYHWEAEGVVLVSRPLAGQILVMDDKDLRVLRTINAGAGARFFDVNEEGRMLFVGNYLEGTLRKISYDEGETIRMWTLGYLVRGVLADPEKMFAWANSMAGAIRIDMSDGQ